MTPPMTRPVTPIMWAIILAIFLFGAAMPFARNDGMIGWVATSAVIIACVSLWGLLLLGFFRRLRDNSRTKRN
jgi:membrane associated rhomboid family serine protease